MGRMADVAMVLVVGGIGLYALYAYNNGQLDQFFSGPDDVNGDTGDSSSGGSGSCADTMGCCEDNAGNTCWRGTTANGIKVGGCQAGGGDCDSARDDFIDQFGEDDDDNDNDNKKKKKSSGGKGTTPSAIGPTKVGKGGKVISKPSSVPSGSKAACNQFTGATKTACLKSRYATTYLGSAFNRRGPSYNYRDDFTDRRHMEFPDLDWYSQASKSPYFTGIESQERAALLKRFQSNFSSMRISIA